VEKPIQQRSDFFALLWSLMHLPVPYIHACAYFPATATTASATNLWLAATPLSLPGAETVYSDIPGLIVL